MDLQGKKIDFLGDSITEGYGTDGPAFAFPSLLQEELGLAAARNYGIGGTRIARQQLPAVRDNHLDDDYCARIKTLDPDADVIFIFGGTNDYGHGNAPFGQWGDCTPDSFTGAVRYLLEQSLSLYPRSLTVIATPIERLNSSNPFGDGGQPFAVPPLSAYVEVIRRTAADMGVPLLDLFACSELDPNDPLVRGRLVPDGLHPNNVGHLVLAGRIARFLRELNGQL